MVQLRLVRRRWSRSSSRRTTTIDLDLAVAGVLRQTVGAIEVVIIGDGVGDDTVTSYPRSC